MQIGHQRIQLGLALDGFASTLNIGVGIGHTEVIAEQRQFFAGHLASQHIGIKPGVGGHVGFRYHIARVDQVNLVPLVGVAATDTGQIRTCTLGAPQEGVLPDALTCDRVVTVTLGFGTERTDHLAVAVGAAFANEDVAPFHLQSGVGLEALHRLGGLLLEEQRSDFNQPSQTDGEDDADHQHGNAFFKYFVTVIVAHGLTSSIMLAGRQVPENLWAQ
ncbi:hypothetical protein AERO8C_160282 [Aeromonas veronii]|uniref:Uncharacterized protein n=1 Tax=Aeromonas veronii TaxID=654 RepID=A0A653KXR8_AERVE|nr:hypothetical protein AERO8C_160282 [Aeromonas veronii]